MPGGADEAADRFLKKKRARHEPCVGVTAALHNARQRRRHPSARVLARHAEETCAYQRHSVVTRVRACSETCVARCVQTSVERCVKKFVETCVQTCEETCRDV